MKGLNGTPQNILWDLMQKHEATGPQVVAAILTRFDRGDLSDAVHNFMSCGDPKSLRRPYKRSMTNAPRPRTRSRYGFANLINDPDGRRYISAEFKVTPGWIIENARGFVRRWNLTLKYEKSDEWVHIWITKPEDKELAQRVAKNEW